jgi:hypothetical protein
MIIPMLTLSPTAVIVDTCQFQHMLQTGNVVPKAMFSAKRLKKGKISIKIIFSILLVLHFSSGNYNYKCAIRIIVKKLVPTTSKEWF